MIFIDECESHQSLHTHTLLYCTLEYNRRRFSTIVCSRANLVSVRDVVVRSGDVAALFVVVRAIVRAADDAGALFRRLADEKDLRIIEDFVVLESAQFVHVLLHGRVRRHSLRPTHLPAAALPARTRFARTRRLLLGTAV